MRFYEIIDEAAPPTPPLPPKAPIKKPIKDVEIPVPAGVFTRLGISPGKVFADCEFLQRKHPEYFTTPEEVRTHVESVMSRPTYIFQGNVADHRMLVRTNGANHAVALEVVFKGGRYRVRSAYVLSDEQLQTLIDVEQANKP